MHHGVAIISRVPVIEDDRFDCVASVFGAMFAPRPDRVASELFRVVKPGGTVGMANWGPYGSQGEMFELMSRYGPALPGAEGSHLGAAGGPVR